MPNMPSFAFIKHEAAGGIILLMAAALALALDNSPLAWAYDTLLSTTLAVEVGELAVRKPLLLWINDGLMAVFFLLVGLEIKREIIEGRLSSLRQSALPLLAAIGGMSVPAVIYTLFNHSDAEAMRGWAVPVATDIAFALGMLALLGSRVPVSLKVFLMALAIIDDLGAIAIIALFFTEDLSMVALALAGICLAVLFALNRLGVLQTAPYVLVGIVMWVCVLKSGVHATLAGVAIALAIPLKARDGSDKSPLKSLEHALHPWVAFAVMPLFAFANAGVNLSGVSHSDLLGPIPIGIALGLFLGNQIGIFGFSYAGVRLGICEKPADIGWPAIYGVSLLAGIGFTMSLFIGTLAFASPEHATAVRIGVLAGSTMSAIAGLLVLRLALRGNEVHQPAAQQARAA